MSSSGAVGLVAGLAGKTLQCYRVLGSSNCLLGSVLAPTSVYPGYPGERELPSVECRPVLYRFGPTEAACRPLAYETGVEAQGSESRTHEIRATSWGCRLECQRRSKNVLARSIAVPADAPSPVRTAAECVPSSPPGAGA